jgi:hypothetical protein
VPESLPHQGFRELPPPYDGVGTALTRGRQRRRRRLALQVGAGLTTVALVVAGALAVGGSAGLNAQDRLEPAHGTGLVPSVSSAQPSAPSQAAKENPSPAAPVVVTAASTGSPSPTASRNDVPTRPQPYRTPALSRSYTPARALSASPSVSVCGGNYAGGTDGVGKTRANWCVDERVSRSAGGLNLVVELCRDESGAGELTFSGAREVEIVVQHGNREVWRWSVDHPQTGPGHALSTPATACWTWTAPWTTVDQHGRALPKGDYTMLATTQAAEVATFPSDAVAFSV